MEGYGKMESYTDREHRQREAAMRKREPNPYPVFDGAPPTGSSSASSGVTRPPGGFSGSSKQEHHYAWD